ncbi:hypothetical protein RhiirA5_423525 [Rhizophagus irregularis]|uniref:DUF7431 domain-containing protein n=1 Tax=Rhizophagus irregularis TaxID=588596 RepID=A0A2N0P9V2_9GLOM|nr:hypothetical protein RhiirA5_423525 [Rhizophagus irregularis]
MSFKTVNIQIINGFSPQCISKDLNLEDILSDIRNSDDDINDTLSFSTKLINGEHAKIEREVEKYFRLKEIITIDNDQYILYLRINSDWKFLNDKCKLDYGCTMSYDGIKKANKRAFIMKDCELTKIGVEGYKNDSFKLWNRSDLMAKTNLFFSSDDNVNNFVDMGLSVESESKKNEDFDDEIYSVYEYTEVEKAFIKFREHIEPTEEFIKEIKDGIKSDNPEKEFRKIMEEYGQFIPTEIILGGRVYFKVAKIAAFHEFKFTRTIGGKHHEGENFTEKDWIESLNDYQNWDIIELKNPIIIFKLLPEDTYKQIIFSLGKKVLYRSLENYSYKSGVTNIYDLINKVSPKIIQNKDADCDIFATVIENKFINLNYFFNCQILKSEKTKPSILIHCIQKDFQLRECNLIIEYVVIGYDTDFKHIYSNGSKVELRKFVYDKENREFDSIPLQRELVSMIRDGNSFGGIPILNNLNPSNESLVIGHNFRKTSNDEFKIDLFSYCTKTHRYVNLPKFTFYTLVILNNDVNQIPFEFKKQLYPFINYDSMYVPFVSLYLINGDNYSPIFLNRARKQINIGYVDCNCNKTCFICKNKTKRISNNDQISCTIIERGVS